MITIRDKRGFILITMVGVGLMMVFFLNSFLLLFKYRAGAMAKRWSGFVAEESARSGFHVLEAALRRRLWEVPPVIEDGNCLRSENFGVEGSVDSGASFKVAATYDLDTKIVEMESTGEFLKQTTILRKNFKVSDISEYMVFSQTSETYAGQSISTHNNRIVPTLIAGSRKLYWEGKLTFGNTPYVNTNKGVSRVGFTLGDKGTSYIARSFADWASKYPASAFTPHLHTTHIMQGDRIHLLGGLEYGTNTYNSPFPDPTDPIGNDTQLQTFLNNVVPGGAAGKTWNHPLHTYITGDPALATELKAATETHVTPSTPSATFRKGIYPRALFGRGQALPLIATGSTQDLGLFENDIDRWTPIYGYFVWDNRNYAGTYDMTCQNNGKGCSNSSSFPKGFLEWKKAADLEGVLIGSEGTKIDFSQLDWDNLEALEEEADMCGAIVTSASSNDGTHEDCDLTAGTISAYHANPGTNPCAPVVDLNLDNLGDRIANFDADAYAGVDSRRIMRRVVYLRNRTQISQNQALGIWPTLANPAVRSGLPIWIVGENEIMVKPFQPDLATDQGPAVTPPLWGIRKAYFNEDADTANDLNPLSLVLMSALPITLLTPTHVPMTFEAMKEQLNLTLGSFHPKRNIFTDWKHQEDDAFKFGPRDIFMSNVAVVTQPSGGTIPGFFLRGLWGNGLSYTRDVFSHSCWLAEPGGPAREAGSYNVVGESPATLPPAHRTTDGTSGPPPPKSRFYRNWNLPANTDGSMDRLGSSQAKPYAMLLMGESSVTLKGLRIIVNFSSVPHPTKGNIKAFNRASDTYSAYAGGMFDSSNRKYNCRNLIPDCTGACTSCGTPTQYADCNSCGGQYSYKPSLPGGAQCSAGAGGQDAGFLPTSIGITYWVNSPGNPDFFQWEPDFGYDNLGAIAQTDLPATHVREIKQ